jgi:hypothetical protein
MLLECCVYKYRGQGSDEQLNKTLMPTCKLNKIISIR